MTLLLDLLLVLALVLTMVAGARNGFFREIFSFLGMGAGLVLGIRFTPAVLKRLPTSLQGNEIATAVVFLLVFLLSFFVLALLGGGLAMLWEGKKPSPLSRVFGVLLGAGRGALLVLLLAAALALLAPLGSQTLGASHILPLLTGGIHRGALVLPEDMGQRLLRRWNELEFSRPDPTPGVQASEMGGVAPESPV